MAELGAILRTTPYGLTIFPSEACAALEVWDAKGRLVVTCLATGKARPAKPEEIVRQLFV